MAWETCNPWVLSAIGDICGYMNDEVLTGVLGVDAVTAEPIAVLSQGCAGLGSVCGVGVSFEVGEEFETGSTFEVGVVFVAIGFDGGVAIACAETGAGVSWEIIGVVRAAKAAPSSNGWDAECVD